MPKSKDVNLIIIKHYALKIETGRLVIVYQKNLLAIDELKKSLLHQAFSGAL